MGHRGNNTMLQSIMKKFSLQKNSDSKEYIPYDFTYRKSKIKQKSPMVLSQEMLASV